MPRSRAAERWLTHTALAPAFTLPATLAAWTRERRRIRTDLQRLLGALPERPSRLLVRTRSREVRRGYILERLQFDNGAGAIVPAYLLLPNPGSSKTQTRTGTRAPAILYCHWHGGQYALGKNELIRRGHMPVRPGPALARLGYVVLAIDAYGFGDRSGEGPNGPRERGAAEEMSAAKFNLWVGRTLWGMMLRDDLIALDYLRSRPDVDPDRIGVTGISFGATRTWWLMALDERLRAGVAVACLTRYRDLMLEGRLAEHGIYYYVPGVLTHFDTEAVVSLVAPRPLLCLTGDQDPGSPIAGVGRIGSTVSGAYRLYGTPQHFRNVIYRGVGHEYLPDMWTRMVDWMGRYLIDTS